MSSEIDHPRQRTVAELLAEHGGGDAASGRRRRRREAELAAGGDAPLGAPPEEHPAAPAAAPDRSMLRRPVPPEQPGYAPPRPPGGGSADSPWADDGRRPYGHPGSGPDRGGTGTFELPRRRDSGRNDVPDPYAAPGRGGGHGGAWDAAEAFGGPGRDDPAPGGSARDGVPPGDPGAFRGRNGTPADGTVALDALRRNGASGAVPAPGFEPGRRSGRNGSLVEPDGRDDVPEPPPASGPQTQVVAPVAPDRATEQMPRMRGDGTAMIDPLLTAPIAHQDDGPSTMVGRVPAGAEDRHRERVARRRADADDGPATELAGLPDLEDDHPAGLDVDGLRSSSRRSERPAASPGQAWAAVVAQWIVGAIGGAALWVGFRFLWQYLPVVAIAAAALVTVGLVLVVRHLLRNDDRRTTLFAVLVGLLLTVSPAVLVLLHRT